MLVLLLPIAVVLVGGCAYLVVSMVPTRTRVGRWLALWIAAWVEVVFTVEVLSLFDAVTPAGFLVCYVLLALIAVAVWYRRGRPRVRLLTLPRRSAPAHSREKKSWKGRGESRAPVHGLVLGAFLTHPAVGVLLVVLALCTLVNVVLGVGLPVNNYDANTYHLSRVGYWIQHGSTDHYFTHNERQNFMPPNAEYGFLALMIFVRAEWPAPLAQLAAYLICIVAVYAIARELGASDAAALFAALLLGTMTEIVLQATVPKNDLLVSSFLAPAVAFALLGLGGGDASPTERARALVWSGLAVGLAFGTKTTALLFLPGLALGGIAVAVGANVQAGIRRLALWSGCCLAGVLLLGSFNYVRNWSSYGSPTGPRSFSDATRIARPSVRSVASNLARYGYHLCDFGGVWPRPMARLLTETKARAAPAVFDALGLEANAPDINLAGAQDSFPINAETGWFDQVPHLHEDVAWFGPIAFFVGLPLGVATLIRAPIRRRWSWFAVALMPAMLWLVQCIVLRYSKWNGRYLIVAAVSAAPVLALAYTPWAHRRNAAMRVSGMALTWLLVVMSVTTALTATLFNAAKPIVPRPVQEAATSGEARRVRGVLTLPRLLVRSRYNTPAAGSILSLPADILPETITLGIVLGGDDWDWPLFGPRMRRRLVPLPPDAERVASAFDSGEVDMVAIMLTAAPLSKMGPIIGERRLFVMPDEDTDRTVLRLHIALPDVWSFLVPASEPVTLFLPTRDWTIIPGKFWIDGDQQFVPTRLTGQGHVEFRFTPNPKILGLGPLVFDFIGQGQVIHQMRVSQPGDRRVILDWHPGPAVDDQILHVRVHSEVNEADAIVQRVDNVYELTNLIFHPVSLGPSQP
ncbi:MAG: glycosyltransferase family 39 protein [Verrucomicrobia bacterium]|nr:glycosyltransferase family 39 protein [Verrucomicrobiota bacterium]